MAARLHPRCGCGKRCYRSRGHALRQLDTSRARCARAGQPTETWPVTVYRCPRSRWWHHASDRRAWESTLRTSWQEVTRLLATA